MCALRAFTAASPPSAPGLARTRSRLLPPRAVRDGLPCYARASRGLPHEFVCVHGAKAFLTVVQPDAVWVSLVPKIDDGALDPLLTIRLNGVAHLEAQNAHFAIHDPLLQRLLVQVAADEYQATLPDLRAAPTEPGVEAPVEEHVHALEHKLLGHALDREHTFVAEEVLRRVLLQLTEPHPQLLVVQLTLKADARGAHGQIVLVFTLGVEKLRIHLQGFVQREGFDVDELRRLHLAVLCADDVRI
mmetsp:Transcript_171501/g.549693  ORF Transcript_171501/g.549693 Transcript_171501/m.549693 type:complete len:245 (-) Transcript_171501:624-1358(-)